MRAADFTGKLGFNTNFNAGETQADILAALTTLGGFPYVIRDSLWSGSAFPTGATYNSLLSASNVRLHLGYQGATGIPSTPMATWINDLKTNIVTPFPGRLIGVAGPNEPDNQGFTYSDGSGGTAPAGITAANTAQADLFAAMRADPALRSIPVDMWPAACGYSANVCGYQTVVGNQTAVCDRTNLHAYFGTDQTNQPTGQGAPPAPGNFTIQNSMYLSNFSYRNNALAHCNHAPFVITESGWQVPWTDGFLYSSNTDERTRARLVLDAWFDCAAVSDCKGYYYYNLHENGNHWGITTSIGAATASSDAVKNMMTVLNDPAGDALTFLPVRLPYTVSGLIGDGTDNVFQLEKSGGKYDYLLWREMPIFNMSTGADITITSISVTVSWAPAVMSGGVYDPVNNGTTPISTFSGVTSVLVSLNDAPLIIEAQ